MSTEPSPMTPEEVCAAVDTELRTARILRDGKIGKERAMAYQYYFGEPFGNEEAGRSQIVSQLVMEIIDSMMPDLIKIFAGGEKAVEFVARKQDDVPLAEQATEVCNYVFYTQNKGFLLLYEAIKDALMQKTGCWKYWWDVEKKVSRETFYGLTEGQILIMTRDKTVEIVAATPHPGPWLNPPAQPQATPPGAPPPNGAAPAPSPGGASMPQAAPSQDQPETLYDVTVKRTKESGHICVESVPPEELLISSRANTVDTQKLPFIAHETRKTRSELVEMGYDVQTVIDLPAGDSDVALTEASVARQTRTEGMGTDADWNSADPMQQLVTYVEAHQYLDADGDGISELRRICKVGSTILSDEPTERVNLAVITPKIMPHEFFGVSLADDSMDLQLLKSTLWRMMLDSGYLSLYPRTQVVESMASANTYADLMAPGPGRPVRVKAAGAITPFEVPFVGQQMFPMLEMIEQEVEGRTPVSRNYQGIPDNVLNKTATQQVHESTRSQSRVELIARIFAETGVKELFLGILWLLGKYQQEPMIVRVSDKYVPMDPRAWNTEYDMTCNVGLGLGSKGEQLMLLNNIAQAQAQAVASGGMGLLVSPKNIYNLQAKVAQVAGFKDPNSYWTAPPDNWQPPPPQPSPQEKVEQMRQQGDAQKTQALHQQEAALMQAQMQQKQREQDHAFQLKQQENQMALQLQQSNDQRQSALDQQKHALDMAKIQADAQLQIELRNIDAAAKVEVARIAAGTDAGTALLKAEADAAGYGPIIDKLHEILQTVNAPKTIIRDGAGRAIGVQPATVQ